MSDFNKKLSSLPMSLKEPVWLSFLDDDDSWIEEVCYALRNILSRLYRHKNIRGGFILGYDGAVFDSSNHLLILPSDLHREMHLSCEVPEPLTPHIVAWIVCVGRKISNLLPDAECTQVGDSSMKVTLEFS